MSDSAVEAAPAPRFPLPTEAAIKVAEQQVREVMGDGIAKAKTPAERVALSGDLLTTGKDTADPAAKFVLIEDAERLAADAGDVEATVAAHSALTSRFELGGSKLAVESFQKLTRGTLSVGDAQKLCPAMLDAAQDATAGDHFEIARQITRLAGPCARILNDPATSERLSGLVNTIGTAEAVQRKVAPALATLASHPDDPAANAEVGKYRCFVKEDWAAGLPMLAKSNDDALKQLAARDLAAPASAADRMAVADAWWDYADTQSTPTQKLIRLHAARWYADAAGGLGGLLKLKAQKRAEEYVKAHPHESSAGNTSLAQHGPDSFASPLEILQSLPANLFPSNVAEWDDAHQNAVNDLLYRQVVGRDGNFRLVVQSISNPSPNLIRLRNRTVPLGQFAADVTVTFDPPLKEDSLTLQNGSAYAVTGRISTARFNGTRFQVHLMYSRILSADGQPQAGANGIGTSAARGEYTSIEQVLAAVPLDVMPKGDEWLKSEKKDEFSRLYRDNFEYKTITVRVPIEKITQVQSRPLLFSSRFPVGWNNLVLSFEFDAADAGATDVKTGQTCTISGKVGGRGWGPAGLTIALHKCHIIAGK